MAELTASIGGVLATLAQLIGSVLSNDVETWTVRCTRPTPEPSALVLTYERVGERRVATFHGARRLTAADQYPSHEPYTHQLTADAAEDGGPGTLRLASAQDRMRDTREWVPDGNGNHDGNHDGHRLTGAVTRHHHLSFTWIRHDADGTRRAYHWTRDLGPTLGTTLAERKATYDPELWPHQSPADAERWDCQNGTEVSTQR